MSVHPYWHEEAGPWVAYRDQPKRRRDPGTGQYERVAGETTRVYLHNAHTGTGMVGDREKNDRFHTKAEALAHAKRRWPRRTPGFRIGAENVGRWKGDAP